MSQGSARLIGAGLGWLTGTGWQLQSATLAPRWALVLLVGIMMFIGLAAWAGWTGRAAAPRSRLSVGLRHPVLWFAMVALLGWSTTTWRAQMRLADRLAPALEGVTLQVRGDVTGLPLLSADGVRFDLDVLDPPPGVPTRLRLGWWRAPQQAAGSAALPDVLQDAPSPGERWRLTVRLKRPHGLMNPGGFDQELQWFEQGIGATGSVQAGTRERPADGEWVARWRAGVREAIRARVADPSAAGLLIALSVGDQAAIERADWAVFRVTGVAHLVAISGMHVTMFAWLAAAVLKRLWVRLGSAPLWCPAASAGRWGGVLAAAGYALLSGWGVPAQRTVWMLATAALLRSGGRHWPWPLVLGTAGAVVTVLDPWALLQPGFWLSFVAVAVLMADDTGPAGRDGLSGPLVLQGLWAKAFTEAGRAVLTQLRISVALAPLGLLFFQQVSLVGLLANLIAIPFVSFVVTPLALGGMLWSALWQAAAALIEPALHGLTQMAQWPAAAWQAPTAPALWWALALLGLLMAGLPWPRRLRLLGVVAMLPVFLQSAARPSPGEFTLLAADVGQGNAVLIRTATHDLLYDAGPQYGPRGDAGERVLVPLLRAQGVERLDLLVLSHRDTDHTGGAEAVLRVARVRRVTSSLEDGHPLRQRAPHQPCATGQRWRWDGVAFEVLHPDDPAASARSNARSCVLRVAGRGGSALLTGDIEALQELRLVERLGARLAADVLLVPHHGSKTSSLPVFVQAVHPKWAVVQAGYRNRYRHPAPSVMAVYRAAGVPVRRSDLCGAWHWSSADGANWCARHTQRRYWHATADERDATGEDGSAEAALPTPESVWP